MASADESVTNTIRGTARRVSQEEPQVVDRAVARKIISGGTYRYIIARGATRQFAVIASVQLLERNGQIGKDKMAARNHSMPFKIGCNLHSRNVHRPISFGES